MKPLIAIIVPCLLLMGTCAYRDSKDDPAEKKNILVANERKIDFEKEVLPVLVKNCSPCHFTGGKMYDKLPFDKESTLINNAEKILKRVEKDEKKAIVKEFILQNLSGKSGNRSGR
ncbi:MAG: hypothetical protein ACHQFX_00105 [Chitinophagales bacterium]